MFKLILLISLAIYAMCTPLDQSLPHDQPNGQVINRSDAIPSSSNAGSATNEHAETIKANPNSDNKHETKRDTAPAKRDDPKSLPKPATGAKDHKERKARDTANKSAPAQSGQADNVKKPKPQIDAQHKKSERPKRQSQGAHEQKNEKPKDQKSDNSRPSRSNADGSSPKAQTKQPSNQGKDVKPKATSNSPKH